MNLIIYSTG